MNISNDIQVNASQLHQFYSGYFSYYNTLTADSQQRFISRCMQFMSQKQIVGAEGFEPDNRVRAIISASAVQLTLGLDRWSIEHFDTIIIHPSHFENKASGLRFKGETNLLGFIRLSWKSFISGYKISNDNINLGLHEFTHALRFNPFHGAEQDYFVEHYFNRWLAAANEAFSAIRKGEDVIFRKYGGTNLNEFMSVCIEHFFESPEEILESYPFLYYSTAILLNQRTVNGKTVIGVRPELFEASNHISDCSSHVHLSTALRRTSSFVVMLVAVVPAVYTIAATGIISAASLFLIGLLIVFYFKYDYYFVSAEIHRNKVIIKKGRLLFKNRSVQELQLSQLISLRAEQEDGGTDWELIYYNLTDESFYSEVILSSQQAGPKVFTEMWMNRVAIFKK